MALSAANKTANKDNTDLTNYNTASVAFTANRLYLLAVGVHRGGGGNTPTATGTGLTWTEILTLGFGTVKKITVFRAMPGSDTTTVSNIDFAAQSQSHCFWSIDEWQGMVTTGSNGAGAIVQSVSNSTAGASNLTVTLAALASANNGCYGTFLRAEDQDMTEGSGFTKLSEVTGTEGSPTTSTLTEWALNDVTVDCSWPSSGAAGGIAIEIAAAAAVGGAEVVDPFGMSGFFGA